MTVIKCVLASLVMLYLLPIQRGMAQAISVQDVTSDLTVCGQDGSFSVQVTNNSAAPLSNLTLSIGLVPGTEYINGSIAGGTFLGQTTDSLFFFGGNVANGGAVTFAFDLRADCAALDTGSVTMVYVLRYDGASSVAFSQPFSLDWPSLGIQPIFNASYAGGPGTTFPRCVPIINGGNGELATFEFSIVRDPLLLSHSNFTLGSGGAPLTVRALLHGRS